MASWLEIAFKGYPPPPVIFWNHGVTATLPSKSLRDKELCVKYCGIKT